MIDFRPCFWLELLVSAPPFAMVVVGGDEKETSGFESSSEKNNPSLSTSNLVLSKTIHPELRVPPGYLDEPLGSVLGVGFGLRPKSDMVRNSETPKLRNPEVSVSFGNS